MPLIPGDKLGPYEILAAIGAGGMGEVWKARDTRLNRIVAIKQSRAPFSERFEREAHAIGALNHPHICQIYDVGPDYLVMEYVEGQPLKGPVPVNEALDLAGQILDALDAAHRKGITHRDLKPDNILVGKSGVKILDFGLAKMDRESEAAEQVLTKPLTAEGTVLGTLHYMSPEQIEGQEADARSDIFAFGLVLYELITGQRAFEGKTRTSLVASILKDQPRPLSELQPLSPPALERVVGTCLEKDPDKRWQSARELKHALEWISTESPGAKAPAPSARKRSWLWLVGAVAALLTIAGFLYLRPKPAPVQAMRFEIAAPEGTTLTDGFSVSPDGHRLAFIAVGADKVSRVWVRALDSGEAQPLSGTENAVGGAFPAINPPIWSPDSRSLIYSTFSGRPKFFRVEASGGAPQEIPDIGGITPSFGGFWTSDNRLVLAQLATGGGIRAIPLSGGKSVTLVQPRANGVFPNPLPDGRHFLYSEISLGPGPNITGGNLMLGNLNANPDQSAPKKILPEPTLATFIPASADSGKGYLLFVRGFMSGSGVLMAQAFDAKTQEFLGEPVTIAEHVGRFAAAPAGVLVYRAPSPSASTQPQGQPEGKDAATPSNRPRWYDRQGKQLETAVEEPGIYIALALSSDEKQLAATRLESTTRSQIWVFDLARKNGRRFTFSQLDFNPVWSPDSEWIVYTSSTAGHRDLYIKPSNGAGDAQPLFKSGSGKTATSWSRDGRFLLVQDQPIRGDITVLPMKGGTIDATRMPYVFESKGSGGRFSPDMRWVAYVSLESGTSETWVRPFDGASATASPSGGKWMISRGGGTSVRWRGDGKELFYAAPDGTIMSVEVNTKPGSPVFDAGVPKPLFKGSPVLGIYWDVSADGKRFLLDSAGYMSTSSSAPVSNAPYKVVLNWTALMTRK